MKKKEFVILVNASGKKTGVSEKIEAHKKGLLHRAFSIFIFNDKNEMLLQQRAFTKYHFAGMWTNSCCSHPRPGEKTAQAASRRLKEELNIELPIIKKGSIQYKYYDDESKLFEHEFDFIFTGNFNGAIHFNMQEVAAVKWVTLFSLKKDIKKYPSKYTPWFKQIMQESEKYFY